MVWQYKSAKYASKFSVPEQIQFSFSSILFVVSLKRRFVLCLTHESKYNVMTITAPRPIA